VARGFASPVRSWRQGVVAERRALLWMVWVVVFACRCSKSRFPSSDVKIEWGSAPMSTWQGDSSIRELFSGGFLADCFVVPPD
jgi:hypothetical protein